MLSKIKQNPIKYVRTLMIVLFPLNAVLAIVGKTIELIRSSASVGIYIYSFSMLLVGFVPTVLFIVYLYKKYDQNKSHFLFSLYYISLAVSSLFVIVSNSYTLSVILQQFQNSTGTISVAANIADNVVTMLVYAFLCVDIFLKFRLIKISRILMLVKLVRSVLSFLASVVGFFSNLKSTPYLMPIDIFSMEISLVRSILTCVVAVVFFIFWKYCLGKSEPAPGAAADF